MSIAILCAIFALIFTILGIVLLATSKSKKPKSQPVLNWPSVPCQILSATLLPQPSTDPALQLFEPQIIYSFLVNNQSFTGNRISFVRLIGNYADSLAILQRYPIGAIVPVYFNPQLPQDCVLELPGKPRQKSTEGLVFGIISLVIALILWLLLVIGILQVSFPIHPAATQAPAPLAPNSQENQSAAAIPQGSNSQSDQNSLQATQPPVNCSGWTIHLFNSTTSDFQGMTFLGGEIAVENVSAPVGAGIGSGNDLPGIMNNAVLTTDQGFTYSVQNWNFQNLLLWVPPGFRYLGPDGLYPDFHQISTEAAASTTNRILQTACGNINYDRPETNLVFPTDLPASTFLYAGTPVTVGDATLTYFYTQKEECSSYVDTVCAHIEFTNNNQGYEVSYAPTIMLEGSDGILHMALNGIYYLHAGPGQTTELAVAFHDTSQTNCKLIIIIDNQYWVYNVD